MKKNLFILLISVAFLSVGCGFGDSCFETGFSHPNFPDISGCPEGEYCNTDSGVIQGICGIITGFLGDFLPDFLDWLDICSHLDILDGYIGECQPIEE